MAKPLKIPFEPARDRLEYERQPRETDRAWQAFLFYRDFGIERTMEKVVDAYRQTFGAEGKRSSTLRILKRYSGQWGWRRRVDAWDRELDRHRRKMAFHEIEKMRDRHVKLSQSMQSLGATELRKWLEKCQQKVKDKEVIKLREVIQLIEAGVKLERTTRGEPESIVEERQQLSVDDERKAMRVLLGDTQALEAVDTVLKKINKQKTEWNTN